MRHPALRRPRVQRPATLNRGHERGSVSVELALGLPSVVLVLGFVLAGASWVHADIAATHAATTAVRVALTEGDGAAAAAATRIAGGTVVITREGDWIVARVSVRGKGAVPDAVADARVPAQP